MPIPIIRTFMVTSIVRKSLRTISIMFILASGFISDTASLLLVVSNLVNILFFDIFGVGFVEYASRTIVPTLFSVAASLLVLYLFYRRSIPKQYDLSQLKKPSEAIKDLRMFKISCVKLIFCKTFLLKRIHSLHLILSQSHNYISFVLLRSKFRNYPALYILNTGISRRLVTDFLRKRRSIYQCNRKINCY
ncbi:hypothetical protein HQN88_14110 [Paenibacillus qinlingensis]|nr:hypothetical protein [Paenibacillus qinlingensis]